MKIIKCVNTSVFFFIKNIFLFLFSQGVYMRSCTFCLKSIRKLKNYNNSLGFLCWSTFLTLLCLKYFYINSAAFFLGYMYGCCIHVLECLL